MVNIGKAEVKDMVKERFIKSVYMGFLLDKSANDYLEKTYELTDSDLDKFILNYNCNSDYKFNNIRIENSSKVLEVKTIIGNSFPFEGKEKEKIYNSIEELINKALKDALAKDGIITVYDLNTFEILNRVALTTMGDKYNASNRKRYTVTFAWLYSII